MIYEIICNSNSKNMGGMLDGSFFVKKDMPCVFWFFRRFTKSPIYRQDFSTFFLKNIILYLRHETFIDIISVSYLCLISFIPKTDPARDSYKKSVSVSDTIYRRFYMVYILFNDFFYRRALGGVFSGSCLTSPFCKIPYKVYRIFYILYRFFYIPYKKIAKNLHSVYIVCLNTFRLSETIFQLSERKSLKTFRFRGVWGDAL